MENSKAIATCRGSKYEVVLKQHFDNGDWVVTYVDEGVRPSFSESDLSANASGGLVKQVYLVQSKGIGFEPLEVQLLEPSLMLEVSLIGDYKSTVCEDGLTPIEGTPKKATKVDQGRLVPK